MSPAPNVVSGVNEDTAAFRPMPYKVHRLMRMGEDREWYSVPGQDEVSSSPESDHTATIGEILGLYTFGDRMRIGEV